MPGKLQERRLGLNFVGPTNITKSMPTSEQVREIVKQDSSEPT